MSQSNIDLNLQTPPMSQTPLPACQKCGRQDETVRLIVFPYVFSIVVMTFRRAFSGLWCKTHRNQYLTVASLITSIFGWLGIPFGFIYTPIVLIQLAKGGVQPVDENIQILTRLAEDKLRRGDSAGAIRCLEECLRLKDDPEIRQRLRQIRPRYGAQSEAIGCLHTGLRLLGTLYLGMLIGTAIGAVDYGSRLFISMMLHDEVPLFIAVLGWAPLLAGIFLGGVGLAKTVEQTLLRVQTRSLRLAIPFAIGAALFILYGIFEGAVIADNIYSLLNGQFESVAQMIVVGLITLIAGGFVWIAVALESPASFIIFLIIILIAAIYFLYIITWTARETIAWQKRINTESFL